ncbi:GNAT family protein [Phytomonospora sp. NPDC050363]|uniref:GNAT family N-acetyltransferase n=1 Tax=Phytomonospora sp. NPDC050363 TaxID=3155642 RepID=UPI00340CAD27
MITGGKVLLRPRHDADVAVLHENLYENVATRAGADTRPWLPRTPSASPYAVAESDETIAFFSVQERDSGELAGACELWGVDAQQRSAHLGVAILPGHRRRGLATDVVAALCEYGFAVRGLHRLNVETLTDNTGMITAATRAGFVHEGVRRQTQWVYGDWKDEAVLGLLAADWFQSRRQA